MNATKDELKSAPRFTYDKDSTTWVPDKKGCSFAINLYGQAKDIASGAAEGVRKTASSFEDIVRHTKTALTPIVIALALGWLFGRTHRPF